MVLTIAKFTKHTPVNCKPFESQLSLEKLGFKKLIYISKERNMRQCQGKLNEHEA